ncbi:hypothetical protein PULV_a0261 [Pseudoalteromonas ulvae UL12]|uniref:Uncharacterized protein n=1 Tax=Pseudoalteromonas ulvae TaxID=107327 RepID=A0A244CUS8_PSEDV|nr:hypothetical protein [Pseudoalteromonas ulvae]MBE0362715.1 hypothetical protein [Pseudoalteromonas ulvae UL12]OUL59341.1 hypothetical protein B1199_03480 [Pseudoalteromonas ulvae]
MVYVNRPRRKPPRTKKDTQHQYIERVIEELRQYPTKLAIIKRNCDEYRSQLYLKKGFLLAIERFDWVFEVDDDVERIAQQILADDYIGQRLRRYPLLFKGVLSQQNAEG